jgi:hypothetical protein
MHNTGNWVAATDSKSHRAKNIYFSRQIGQPCSPWSGQTYFPFLISLFYALFSNHLGLLFPNKPSFSCLRTFAFAILSTWNTFPCNFSPAGSCSHFRSQSKCWLSGKSSMIFLCNEALVLPHTQFCVCVIYIIFPIIFCMHILFFEYSPLEYYLIGKNTQIVLVTLNAWYVEWRLIHTGCFTVKS